MNIHLNKKSTILIVEDTPELLESVVKCFSDDFEVIAVAKASEAIDKIASATASVDALLTDFNLSEKLDGLDVALAMRAKFPNAPIVLMTGSSPQESRIKALLSLPRTHLALKPFKRAELKAWLQFALS